MIMIAWVLVWEGNWMESEKQEHQFYLQSSIPFI